MAYVTLCHATDPEWLELKRNLVSSTEVAAIMGQSPYGSRAQVLASKVGNIHKAMSRPMWWGVQMEEANMAAFSLITGCPAYHENKLVIPNPQSRLGATLDGFVWSEVDDRQTYPEGIAAKGNYQRFMSSLQTVQGMGIIEMKNSAERQRKHWLKEPPHHYWVQAQVAMYCTNLLWGVVACKIGADDMRIHLVRRDDDFLLQVETEVAKFWQEVEQARKEWE